MSEIVANSPLKMYAAISPKFAWQKRILEYEHRGHEKHSIPQNIEHF